jgi:hypothetical protein
MAEKILTKMEYRPLNRPIWEREQHRNPKITPKSGENGLKIPNRG